MTNFLLEHDNQIFNIDNIEDILGSSVERIISFLTQSHNAKAWLITIFHFYENRNEDYLKRITKELIKYMLVNNMMINKQKIGFIRVLNILTLFYTFLGQKTLTKEEYDEMNIFSTQLINSSEKIDFTNSLTLIAKGYLLFTKGEYDASELTFHNAYEKEMSEKNSNIMILAVIGLALNSIIKCRFNDGVAHLTTLIKQFNFINESILETIGICYYNSGKEEKSFLIFKKTLSLNNRNYNALCYLSIMELNKASSNKLAFEQASDMLISSFELLIESIEINYSSSCHLILSNIISFLLMKNNFNLAEELKNRLSIILDQSIFKYSNDGKNKVNTRKDADKLKSIVFTINGKIAHARKYYSEALNQYAKAVSLNSNNIEAQFALGQLHYFNQNFTEALKCFEICKVTQDFSSLYEVNKFIALVKTKTLPLFKKQSYDTYYSKIEELNILFNQLIDIQPNDLDIIIELAQINEYNKPSLSLELYEKCLKLINSNKAIGSLFDIDEIYPELLNNIASLKISLKQIEGSLELLIKANKIVFEKIKNSVNETNTLKLKAMEISILYNIGIYHEKTFNYGEAYKVFKILISNNPFFVDAYSKLGILAYYRGNYKKAFDYLNQAIEKCYDKNKNNEMYPCMHKPLNPMLIKAVIQQKTISTQEALQTMAKLMQIDDKDPFSLVLIANLNYDLAYNSRSTGGKSAEYQKRITKAIEFYYAALELDSHNAFAAIGIANCLAEFDFTTQALEIYKSLGDKISGCYSKFINEALLYLNDHKYSKAITLLTKTISLIKENEYNYKDLDQIELTLAKALLDNENYDEGLSIIKGLIIKNPENLILRFNFAVGLKTKACGIMKNNSSKVKDLIEAKENLEKAIPLLETINKIRKDSKIYSSEQQEKIFSTGDFIYKLNDTIDICTNLLKQLLTKIEEGKIKEQKELQILQENARKYHEMLSNKKQIETIELERIVKKQKENEDKIDLFKQKALNIIMLRTEEVEKEKRKKKEKIQNEEENSAEENKKKSKVKKGKKSKKNYSSEDEDEYIESEKNDSFVEDDIPEEEDQLDVKAEKKHKRLIKVNNEEDDFNFE